MILEIIAIKYYYYAMNLHPDKFMARKKTWIPACRLGKNLSHVVAQGHFLFVSVNNFVGG